jgi:hypothetical protein
VDKKATKVRKTKSGEKTFYWCHRKTGGQCDPGAWRTHKPEDCRSDEIRAKREKEQKDEKSKGKSLKADQTIIINMDKKRRDDECSITSEEIRIANARYDPYASEQSLSTVDSRAMASDPTYLAKRYKKGREGDARSTRKAGEARAQRGSKAHGRAAQKERKSGFQKGQNGMI